MSLKDLEKEIDYHEKLIKTLLDYKGKDGICRVSQAEIAEKLKKNKPWVAKAIHRLNAEDKCIEMIKKGEYIIHYTNIREKGIFPKIFELLKDKITLENFTSRNTRIHEKYKINKKTAQIFVGYLALILKDN